MKVKYIDPFTGFGFFKIFGEEASKPLLLDFLQALLPQEGKIIELSFINTIRRLRLKRTERPFMTSIVKMSMGKNS